MGESRITAMGESSSKGRKLIKLWAFRAVRPTSSLDRQKWHIVQLQDAMAGLFRKIAWGRQRDDVLTLYSENATWSKDAVPIWMERVLLRKQEIDFGLVFSWEELPENIRKMLRNVGDIPPGLEVSVSGSRKLNLGLTLTKDLVLEDR